MKRVCFALFAIAIAAAACAPSPEIVATAMAQTQAALPTATPPATLTLTPEPPTSTPTEILTPTLTPTSTPDLRVIISLPEDIVCTEDDLPVDGNYSLQPPPATDDSLGASFWSDPLAYVCDHCTNQLIYGTSPVREFISRTKRVDGWLRIFTGENDNYPGFDRLGCYVQQFRTIEGAQLAVQAYALKEIYPQWGFEPLENSEPTIGDVSIWISNTARSGHLVYGIEYSYKNHAVTIAGLNGTKNLDDLYFVAQQILKKLENAALGEGSDITLATPTPRGVPIVTSTP